MATQGWIQKSYKSLVKGENTIRHLLLLLIRLYWGALLVMAGFGKWVNIQAISGFFEGLGIPFPTASAYLVGTVELLGGISLFLGLFSRVFTILLTCLFFVAYATAHVDAVNVFFSNPSLFTTAEPFLYLLVTLIVLCFGPGMFSIDYWLEKKTYGQGL